MTLSKAKIKYIRSLEQKKVRNADHVFVAEGPKVVGDLLQTFEPLLTAATTEWLESHPSTGGERFEVSAEELRKASLLLHPQEVIAVMRMPGDCVPPIERGKLVLALDDIQDPGNLGTIIRIADWFGITDIYCSAHTADAWSPKVVQAAMGSHARVAVHYADLPQLLAERPEGLPVWGTLLDGRNIYNEPLGTEGIIVMGNEGNGLSPAIRQTVTHPLFIPNYPAGRPTADSLNVAVATAITCAEFRRREL